MVDDRQLRLTVSPPRHLTRTAALSSASGHPTGLLVKTLIARTFCAKTITKVLDWWKTVN
jgi:hypothetical protein